MLHQLRKYSYNAVINLRGLGLNHKHMDLGALKMTA